MHDFRQEKKSENHRLAEEKSRLGIGKQTLSKEGLQPILESD